MLETCILQIATCEAHHLLVLYVDSINTSSGNYLARSTALGGAKKRCVVRPSSSFAYSCMTSFSCSSSSRASRGVRPFKYSCQSRALVLDIFLLVRFICGSCCRKVVRYFGGCTVLGHLLYDMSSLICDFKCAGKAWHIVCCLMVVRTLPYLDPPHPSLCGQFSFDSDAPGHSMHLLLVFLFRFPSVIYSRRFLYSRPCEQWSQTLCVSPLLEGFERVRPPTAYPCSSTNRSTAN